MKRFGFAVGAALFAFGFAVAAPSHAQTLSPQEGDLRCAAFGLALAGMPNAPAQQQSGGTMIAIYYIGRVEGRDPSINLEDALFELSQRVSYAELENERQRCAAEFQATGQRLTTMGTNLQRRVAAADGN